MQRDENGHVIHSRGPGESPTCIGCPCAKPDGKPGKPIRAFGAKGSLAIVAEGPGSEEVFQGYPLVGPTGKLLNAVLKRGGIDRAACWITNAILCPRPAGDLDLLKAIDHCRPRLEAELRDVAPTGILALGGTAAKGLCLPVVAISEARGTVQYSPALLSTPVVTSLHPASLFKGGAGEVKGGGKNKQNVDAQMMFLQADTEKAWAIASGKISATWSDDIQVITQMADTETAMRMIIDEARSWGALGLDLEWTQERFITYIGLGHIGRAISIPWDVLSPQALALAADAVANETLPKIIHNLQADKQTWELRVGPMRGQLIDTMLLHHASFPGLAHDLQNVATQFLVVPPWKTERREERKAYTKAEKQHERELVKAEKKRIKMSEHEERNRQKAVEGEARKLARMAKHEAENAAKHEDKVMRKRGRPKKIINPIDTSVAPFIDPIPERRMSRTGDPVTSIAAARKENHVSALVLETTALVMQDGIPRIDEEIWKACRARGLTHSESRIRHSRLALSEGGALLDTGQTRPTKDTGASRVWVCHPDWIGRLTELVTAAHRLEPDLYGYENLPEIETNSTQETFMSDSHSINKTVPEPVSSPSFAAAFGVVAETLRRSKPSAVTGTPKEVEPEHKPLVERKESKKSTNKLQIKIVDADGNEREP